MMDSFLPFISAAGVGGIVGGVVTNSLQALLAKRAVLDERRFREKKEAYTGLFNAMYQVAKENTAANVKEAGYWRARVELMGTEQIRALTKRLFILIDGTNNPEISIVETDLLTAMRADLGIAASDMD